VVPQSLDSQRGEALRLDSRVDEVVLLSPGFDANEVVFPNAANGVACAALAGLLLAPLAAARRRAVLSVGGDPRPLDVLSGSARTEARSAEVLSVGGELRVPKVKGDMPPRPDWFRVPAPGGEHTHFAKLKESVKDLGLSTVCEEAQCPNIGECWNGGTGTIMILGDTCTRGCKFCAVDTSSTPQPPDALEPFKVADAVGRWGVSYVVITSVDRDDMPDGGAAHFALTVELLKKNVEGLLVEALVGDFQGDLDATAKVANSGLDVYAHNLETVPRLQRFVRDRRANYEQSLACLRHAKAAGPPGLRTKTSLMLGLGETEEEVIEAMQDALAAGVDVLTLGQYLRPTEKHLQVVEYVSPEKFAKYAKIGEEMGFAHVAAGPLVRSSYKAGEVFLEKLIRKGKEVNAAFEKEVKGVNAAFQKALEKPEEKGATVKVAL
jgi:lipoic acid synthetase